MDSNQYISLEIQKDIAHVEIRREKDRNAINSAMMAEMATLMDDLESSDVRAVVFSGQGDQYFIGGADGIEMMQLDPNGAHDFSRRLQAVFNRLEQSPLITLAAIDGLCFGGGFEFAMACDLRVATSRTRIGLPEVKVGLIPGAGGTQRLPRLVGLGRALEMILNGRLYGGADAEMMGLIHLCTNDSELEAGVDRLLKPILRRPQYALSLAKSAVYGSSAGSLETGLEIESERFSHCLEHDFFPDLMKEQLKTGVLTTTENVSKILEDGNK